PPRMKGNTSPIMVPSTPSTTSIFCSPTYSITVKRISSIMLFICFLSTSVRHLPLVISVILSRISLSRQYISSLFDLTDKIHPHIINDGGTESRIRPIKAAENTAQKRRRQNDESKDFRP